MLLIAVCCAWVLGIFLGSIFHSPLALVFTALIPVPFAFIFRKLSKYFVLSAICLAVLFGAAFYYPGGSPATNQTASFNSQGIVELKGVIEAPPDVRDNTTHIELSIREIKTGINWQNTRSKILLFVPRYPEYQYGDTLLIKGNLENPPRFDNFDYQAYLAREGIFSTMLNPSIQVLDRSQNFSVLGWIYGLRERLSRVLSAVLPEPQASLAQGIVLGIRSSIPEAIRTNLAVTGTAHLLAISGINLSIVAGIMVTLGLWIFGRRRYIYVWLALLTVWFYALITGMQAPVIRSAIMASLFLFAELLGRQKSAFVALTLSAAIMVGADPQILSGVSFQLSFLAMVGLIFIAPNIQNVGRKAIYARLDKDGWGAKTLTMISDSFSITLGALIAVWPIIAFNFGLISIVGPFSTFLIAPALSFIIIFGALTAVIGLVSLPAAQIFGWVAWIFLSYMLWLINVFAAIPSAAINTDTVNLKFVCIYYAILGLAIWFVAGPRKLMNILIRLIEKTKAGIFRSFTLFDAVPKKLVIIPLLAVTVLTSYTAATLPDNYLHVNVLDVGEGDSIFIKTGNQNILIDGGLSPQAVCTGLSRKMPFWDRNIDLLILTHPHLDHLSGLLEVLRRYRVKQVLAPNLISDSPSFHEWLNLMQTQNIKYNLAQAGQEIRLVDRATLDILNPHDTSPANDESSLENSGIVAKLVLNKISFLFTADIGYEAEARLLSQRADLRCTVLKIAHHGSSTSTSSDFLNVAKPQIAAISVGVQNNFGHPSEDTLNRLKETVGPENIYRTDDSGTIEFTTDGRELWVKTER